ncbi:phytoene desaturase family protein [Actinospongicola halichondriae]|uniref:phytoene desaturase family protein n=1 Tax=Actinospongicola halichondriae TaxID=3236844 RepID=UPI003D58F806
MAEVVVVGAGVGGLSAAIRVAAAGHDVTVVERLAHVGGKLDERSADGFTWETGPSLLTLPAVFRDLAAVAGRDLDELVDLIRLDPICRYRFVDGTGFDHRADLDAAAAEAEALAPGAGRQWREYLDGAETVWDTSERTFFAGPMASPIALLRRMRSPRDLVDIDPLRTLHSRAEATFDDARLVRWADRYATYSGSSPFRAPATLRCIPHLEQDLGAWYVRGGLGRLALALGDLATDVGVDIRTGCDVEEITHAGDRATGVRLVDGERIHGDAVIANADALHLYRDLLPHPRARRRAERTERSSSGFVLLLGVEGRTDDLAHHNVSFSGDYRAEFTSLFDTHTPIADPTIYVAASSVTDPSQAPAGHENWFVLVNAPSFSTQEASGADAHDVENGWDGYGDHVLGVMAERGWDLSGRIVHRSEITPVDIAERFRTPGGSIYGTSSNGAMAAFLRPGNRGPIDGLYVCGGSSHPGGGLPLVAISGKIAADLCLADLPER